jgi:hypothetical protein
VEYRGPISVKVDRRHKGVGALETCVSGRRRPITARRNPSVDGSRPQHQCRHRRDPAHPHPRHQPHIPTHRTPTRRPHRPPKTKTPEPITRVRVSGMSRDITLWSWGESAQLFGRSVSSLLDDVPQLSDPSVRSNRRSNATALVCVTAVIGDGEAQAAPHDPWADRHGSCCR